MDESTQLRLIERACRSIEQREPPPNLTELARSAGLSPTHFQRVFVAAVGVSPKAYGIAHRQRRLRQALHKAPRVTDAIYDAGYTASSAAYRDSSALGMPPARFQKGGAQELIRYCVTRCSLGPLLVAVTHRGVCSVEFVDEASAQASLRKRFPNAMLEVADPRQLRWVRNVVASIESPGPREELPLDIRGTAFQTRVWRALAKIPLGQTLSYSEVARRIGAPTSTRAVAAACASNVLAVVVPCHRVVGTNGKLTGYRWGLERKRAILKNEGLDVADNGVVSRPSRQR
jgi:AraC family transcriptional regulator, regulatory protein of adaptative response / methylated-DNA-[protein]-cysteine methyltransferase